MKACIKGKCPNEHEHADCLGSGEHEPHDWVYKQGWGGIRDFDYHCEGGGALVRDRLLVEPEKELKSTMSGRAVEEGHSSGGAGHDHQTAEQIRADWVAKKGTFLLSPEQEKDVEELRVTSHTGGQKGKKLARYDLIPGEALRKIAELYGRGAGKYEDRNWERGYDWSLSFAALQRHIWQFWNGEDMDEEMGMEHVACAIFHALALLEFMEKHPEFDDRPTTLGRRESAEPAEGSSASD